MTKIWKIDGVHGKRVNVLIKAFEGGCSIILAMENYEEVELISVELCKDEVIDLETAFREAREFLNSSLV